jgi:hypothetical protein
VRLLIFGLGYTALRLGRHLAGTGWRIAGVSRDGRDDSVVIGDEAAVAERIGWASHILSTVPPGIGGDPVLGRYGAALAGSGAWLGYLSSTGVYGDTGGAWVDEGAPLGGGRRTARVAADLQWLALPGARVFRLPGIYGPGRSPLDRVRLGEAVRVDAPGHCFSRIHVDDIVAAVVLALEGPAGAYNLADDLPASQAAVIAHAAALLGLPPPPLVPLAQAPLSPQARAFYAEHRRVASGKARRLLGWRPAFPDYRAGLRALNASARPASASTAPATASQDQR